MLKKAKKIAAMALAFVMTAGMSVTASAAEKQAQVQLNGQNIQFTEAKPIMKNGRLYVPFRTVFENLGAEISYDDKAKLIAAKKEDTSVEFIIGDANVTIKKGEEKTSEKIDAPSFVEKGHTYVPLRFAAQALGCSVGWDNDEQTAIIMDKNEILNQLSGKFTLMDKYMEYSKQFNEGNYAIKGSFTLSASSPLAEEGALNAKGTISGLTNEDVANMNMAVKLDTASLKKFMGDDASLSVEEAKNVDKLLQALKEIKLDVIFNITTGKYYISSPAFELAGLDGDAWYYFDFKEIVEEMSPEFSFTDLIDLSKNASFEEYIKATLDMVPVDSVDSYADLQEAVSIFKELLSDDAFTKTGDTYVSEYKFNEDATDVTLNIKLTEKEDAITGFSVDFIMSEDGNDMLTLNATQNNMDSSVDMTISMPGMFTMKFDMDMSMTETSKKPLAEPPANSKVISLQDAMIEKMETEVTVEEEVVEVTDEVDTTEADTETKEVTETTEDVAA